MAGAHPQHEPPYPGRSSTPYPGMSDLSITLREYIDLRIIEKEKAIERIERNLEKQFIATQDSQSANREHLESKMHMELRVLAERLDRHDVIVGDYEQFRSASFAQAKTIRWLLALVISIIPIVIALTVLTHNAMR